MERFQQAKRSLSQRPVLSLWNVLHAMRYHAIHLNFPLAHVLRAWLAATFLSGVPSTLLALMSGTDVLEPTRAAGRMLLPHETNDVALIAAAALVHVGISLFWSLLLATVLPRRGVLAWSLVASAAVALLDLRLIAPAAFPSVAALPFWPQFADHLMWGVCYGGTLAWLRKRA